MDDWRVRRDTSTGLDARKRTEIIESFHLKEEDLQEMLGLVTERKGKGKGKGGYFGYHGSSSDSDEDRSQESRSPEAVENAEATGEGSAPLEAVQVNVKTES